MNDANWEQMKKTPFDHHFLFEVTNLAEAVTQSEPESDYMDLSGL